MYIALVAALSVASADVSSGPESCVIENYDSAYCEVCSDAYYDDETACSSRLDAEKDLACRSNGASAWDEIWCDPGHTDATGASCASVDGFGAGGFAMFAAAGMALLAGRRRR